MGTTIVFDCEGCGKHYEVDSSLAGKKASCKQCKTVFVIPIPRQPTPRPTVTTTSPQPQSRPKPQSQARPAPPPPQQAQARPVVAAPPPAVDLYGLDDALPPRSSGPRSGGYSSRSSESEEVLPQRPKFPKAKKSKGSGGQSKALAFGIPGAAISFVVMFAVGYRTLHRAGKVSDLVGNIVASVSGDTEYDRLTKGMISLLNELADSMEKVQNRADAQQFQLSTVDLQRRATDLEREARALPNPSQSENDRLERTYNEKLLAATGRVTAQINRLKSVSGMPGNFMPTLPSFPGMRSNPMAGAPNMPGPPPGMPGSRQSPIAGRPGFPQPSPANPAETLTITVTNVNDPEQAELVGDEINTIHQSLFNGLRQSIGSGVGTNRTFNVSPVTDAQAFADKIKFGRVVRVQGRTIEVAATALAQDQRRPGEADFIGRALFDLKSSDVSKRKDAARRLVEAIPNDRRDEVAKAMVPLLDDNDGWMRRQACKALGVWGTDEHVEFLIGRINDQDNGVQEEVIQSLGRLKDPRGAKAIAGLFVKNRRPAKEALIAMGPPAEEAVAPLLRHEDPFVRTDACKVLQEIGGPKSLQPLQFLACRQGMDADAARIAIRSIREANAADSKPPAANDPSSSSPADSSPEPAKSTAPASKARPGLPKGKRIGG